MGKEFLDYRYITSYEMKKGVEVPYQQRVEIGGIETIRAAILQRIENAKPTDGVIDICPTVVVGDLSGLGDFNNDYGRKVADGAILSALSTFAQKVDKHGDAPFSLSGDEMGVLIKDGVPFETAIETLRDTLKSFNSLDYDTGEQKVGLNAKFFIGKRNLGSIEKYLKFHPETGEKLPPGSIVVGKELIGAKKDKVIYPEGVSNEKIIMGRTSEQGSKRFGENEKEGRETGQGGRSETAEEKKTKERLKKLKIAIEVQKSIFGGIDTNHPFVVELKKLQGRGLTPKSGNSGKTRRATENAPRDVIHDKNERLIIHNDDVLWKSKELTIVHKHYRSKMRQTTLLLGDAIIDVKKKKEIVNYLNSKESAGIWRKRSLSSEAILTAGCLKAGVVQPPFADKLNKSELKLITKLVNTKTKGNEHSL